MVLILFLTFPVFISPAKKEIKRLDKKIAVKKKNLGELTTLKKEYNSIISETKVMEQKIKGTAKNVTLPSLLENVAKATDLTGKMTGLKIRDTIKSKNYNENGVEITLKNISLDQLIDFVYKLESLPYIIKVKGFKMKTAYGKAPKHINLTILVSLFTPN
jgi:Tfp pilus assembly protein PilO